MTGKPKDVPRFCPYCGADLDGGPHDSDCLRPAGVTITVPDQVGSPRLNLDR